MTKDEKAEDYDRLSYEYTQLNQKFKSQKRANKKLKKHQAEQLILSGVSNRRELLIDLLDDVLMCQDEGASIVDREKYVDGYLGN